MIIKFKGKVLFQELNPEMLSGIVTTLKRSNGDSMTDIELFQEENEHEETIKQYGKLLKKEKSK